MSKHESNVGETAGRRRPIEDSEAEGIVGGTGGGSLPGSTDADNSPRGQNQAADPRDIPQDLLD